MGCRSALGSGPDASFCRQLLRRLLATALPRRVFLTSGPATSREVCLTFDDGPHPEFTPALLDFLKSRMVRATFFVVGRQAEQYPELVRRMASEGHVIDNHSYAHPRPGQRSAFQPPPTSTLSSVTVRCRSSASMGMRSSRTAPR